MVPADDAGWTAWQAIGPGLFRSGVAELELNVTAVAGPDGFVLVDTGSYERETRTLLRGLAETLAVHDLPYRGLAVVNTHGHFDHCYGNAEVLRAFPDARILGHRALPEYLRTWGEDGRADAVRYGMPAEDMAAVRIVPPTHLVAPGAMAVVEVGGGRRVVVEALPYGAHTSADVVVHVPHCGTLLAGDLVEQSAPPSCGPDAFPFTWPDAIRRALDAECLRPEGAEIPADAPATVVPGHGDVVDAAFAEAQREEIAAVGAELRRRHARGESVEDAVARGTWPWPADAVRPTVRRGFALLDVAANTSRRA